MHPTGNSEMTTVEVLRAAISKLQMQHGRWGKTGSKLALYRYLESVFDCYSTWKRDGIELSASGRIARLTGLDPQRRRHPIRAILDATSTADRRTKSRWYRALRYAWRDRSKWSGLKECLSANGGVAGCASKWADLQAENRTPPGFVRIGGETRFPRVPLFVATSLLDRYGDYR